VIVRTRGAAARGRPGRAELAAGTAATARPANSPGSPCESAPPTARLSR